MGNIGPSLIVPYPHSVEMLSNHNSCEMRNKSTTVFTYRTSQYIYQLYIWYLEQI